MLTKNYRCIIQGLISGAGNWRATASAGPGRTKSAQSAELAGGFSVGVQGEVVIELDIGVQQEASIRVVINTFATVLPFGWHTIWGRVLKHLTFRSYSCLLAALKQYALKMGHFI